MQVRILLAELKKEVPEYSVLPFFYLPAICPRSFNPHLPGTRGLPQLNRIDILISVTLDGLTLLMIAGGCACFVVKVCFSDPCRSENLLDRVPAHSFFCFVIRAGPLRRILCQSWPRLFPGADGLFAIRFHRADPGNRIACSPNARNVSL